MMPIAIDPSERRLNATPSVPPRAGHGRVALLSVAGLVGLAGLSAGAYGLLSGLAGPPPSKILITHKAADWPDLRDGVPALAPGSLPKVAAVVAPAPPVIVPPAPAPVEPPAPRVAMPAPVNATPVVTQPARVPPIENAATVPPAKIASVVPPARPAALIGPTPNETTRSRASGGTFAALPPEPAPAPRKPAAVVAARPKPVAPKVAAAVAPSPVSAVEADPDHTEVFGLKVPTLASTGRKLAEGVESLGNAVKSLPEKF